MVSETDASNAAASSRERAALRIVKAVREMSRARSVETIAAIVKVAARDLVGADGATFVLPVGSDEVHYLDEDAISPLWKGRTFPSESCIGGWAMLHHEQVVIDDAHADERIPIEAYRPTFVRSLVMTPVRPDAPLAAIGAYFATQKRISKEERHWLQTLADATAVAMENVRTHEELETRVRERTADLEAANEELEAFSSSIAHDLRSPLTAVMVLASEVAQDCAERIDPESFARLKTIGAAARQMSDLTEALMQLSRSGHAAIRRERIDLSEKALRIGAAMHDRFADRDVELFVEPGLFVNADRSLMEGLLTNLLENAWKYTAKTPKARVEVGRREGVSEEFYVRDNGAGFSEERAKDLFRPFHRLHPESDFAGTGLGLVIVRRIAERHGGRVRAEGRPGHGATFYFSISPGD
jgi:signal transduction histidine kinase